MDRCTAVNAISHEMCGSVAVFAVTAGCVHEHIKSGPLCAIHAMAMTEDGIICRPCNQSTDSHQCVIRLIDYETLIKLDGEEVDLGGHLRIRRQRGVRHELQQLPATLPDRRDDDQQQLNDT